MRSTAQQLLSDFLSPLGLEWQAPVDLIAAAHAAISGCYRAVMHDRQTRDRTLFALINSKLRLNRTRYQAFLDRAAEQRILLNYHDKALLLDCLDHNDAPRLADWLRCGGHPADLISAFRPITRRDTLAALNHQLATGAVTRCDARKCGSSERRNQVLRSLFGSYIFCALPQEAMHRHFNADSRVQYLPDFYDHLLRFHPRVLHRDCALIFLVVDDRLRSLPPAMSLRESLFRFVRTAYDRLSNHCVLAVLIRPFREDGEDGQWRLFSDLVLYAEKHRTVRLQAGYFHPKEIEQATATHIPGIDRQQADFASANEGFGYRDCFVLPHGTSERIETTSQPVSLLLLFDKNERDETLIPCPACRSRDVAGNSYPVLGVRSWECRNPICPYRSAFDRGNRYSLSALIKQEAIKSDEDQIPDESRRMWKLDVVNGANEIAVVRMLVRHFSLHRDKVLLVNGSHVGDSMYGRKIEYEDFRPALRTLGAGSAFESSSFFKRFLIERDQCSKPKVAGIPTGMAGTELFQGDCFEVLSQLPGSCLDGAVTSPPYYNARSYATWPNIYCYLYDMYNSARQVFRVLKPGCIYLFNIFDYFDNENAVAFSAMGKKRMILGAHIVTLFRNVGFRLDGNIVWYKGEIEGKRNYNQGNHSPYYQLPLNCWEHILIFRKPGDHSGRYKFPTILAAKPVFKMFRGENIHGHSAPFPSAIPELLLGQMRSGERVLDPYSGSMTTGRAAYRLGVDSVSVELHREYCDLGLRALNEECDAPLFRSVV